MPAQEGEQFRIIKAVGKDRINLAMGIEGSQSKELAALQKYFDGKWELLELQEDNLGEVVLSDEWIKKYDDLEKTLENDPEKQTKAIVAARDYALISRARIDKRFESVNSEAVGKARQKMDIIRKGHEENNDFEQYIAFGFDLWAKSEVEKTGLANAVGQPTVAAENNETSPTMGSRAESVSEQSQQNKLLELGWNADFLGEPPTFRDERLVNNIAALLRLQNQLLSTASADKRAILRNFENNVTRVVGDTRLDPEEVQQYTKVVNRIRATMDPDAVLNNQPAMENVFQGPAWTLGDEPVFESDENVPAGSQIRKLWREVKFKLAGGAQAGSPRDLVKYFAEIRDRLAKIPGITEKDYTALDNKLAEAFIAATQHEDEARSKLMGERRLRPFDAFLNFARETGGWDGSRDTLATWLRGWVMKRFFENATQIYFQSPIVGSRVVTAQLQMGGMFYEQSIGTILDFVPDEYNEFRGVAREIYDDLRVLSSVHNRERQYAQVKGLPPDKIAEGLYQLDQKVLGGTEPLRMTGKDYRTLYGMGEVVPGKEKFGNTIRKATALYLLEDLEYADGALTMERLTELGLAVPSGFVASEDNKIVIKKNINGQDTEVTEHVVAYNIFPLEKPDQSSQFVDAQRQAMADILVANGAPNLDYAKLAEIVAFNSIESWFVGAQLDRDFTGKEQAYKLVRTYKWRDKYLRSSRFAGNPLSINEFWATMSTFPDFVKMPTGRNERSLREWLTDLSVEVERIPFEQMTELVDRQFYTDMLGWGAKMFGYILNGTGVTWTSLIAGGKVQEEGEPIDEKHVVTLQELYKYIGYWTGSLSVKEIQAYFQPWTRGGDMDNWSARTRLDEGHSDRLTPQEFRGLVTKKVFRQLIFKELQRYSKEFNSAASIKERMRGKRWGQRMTIEDIERVLELLINRLSNNAEVVALYGKSANMIYKDDKDVLGMLSQAGLLDKDFVAMEVYRSFIKVGTALKFLKGHR